MQQHSVPIKILFGGYRHSSFHLRAKGSPTACFPRCLQILHHLVPLLPPLPVVVRRCSQLLELQLDGSDRWRCPTAAIGGRCRQLAALHLGSSSICLTAAKSVPRSANQHAAASYAAAVQFAASHAMVSNRLI